jgi:cobalt-zinc-cadmium resistance protein CzcA
VVIGGLITSTLLTLLILPVIYAIVYELMHKRENRKLLRRMRIISKPSADNGNGHPPMV